MNNRNKLSGGRAVPIPCACVFGGYGGRYCRHGFDDATDLQALRPVIPGKWEWGKRGGGEAGLMLEARAEIGGREIGGNR